MANVMYTMAKYRWYRRLCGGHWIYSRSCGWFPVAEREVVHHLHEMPHIFTAHEDHTLDDTLLQGILVAVAVVCAVIAVGMASGAIPW